MSDLKAKLEQANKKAETQKAERRARVVKGAHLTDKFIELANEAGCDVRMNTGFHVIVGKAGKSLRIYVAKRGGIVDLLGFTVQDPAVIQISKELAKEKHMGRVEGRLDLEKTDDEVLNAYRQALDVINVPAPVVEPKVKRERKAKTETAIETPIVPVTAPTVEAQPTV
jgi:hypothetical protein